MYVSLLQNAALLVALSTLYSLLARLRRDEEGIQAKILKGLLFGGVAVAGMYMSFHYAPGIIYDGRSITLSMAGLFGGGVASAVAVVVAGSYRAWLGGSGMWAGLATIVGCAVVGLVFRRACKNRPERLGILLLYGFGVCVHITMLAFQLLLPWPSGLIVISKIWQPVMLVFPGATVLMGLFLRNEDRRILSDRDLRERESLLKKFQSIGRVGGWEYDLSDGRITCSEETCRIFGLESRESPLTYATFLDCVHPDERASVDAALRQSIEEERDGWEFKHRIVRRNDNEERIVFEKCEHVKKASGRVLRSIGFVQDITGQVRAEEQRKKLEEQLLQAQKLESVGRLAGGLAHDFNNILTVIMGYGEVVLKGLHTQDPLREDLKEILEAGERAAKLTRQLLAFSRKQTLRPEVLDLNNVLENMEKMLRRLIGEDILLELALSEDLARVEADAGQIEQVVMNLAVNARDAMPGGGKLIIETANVELDDAYALSHISVTPGKYVMIAVTDTGCGMNKDILSNVFEPFFSTKEKGKGTGLGLSTVYGIVKQSGGNIWAYSEPGGGTTFKIYLPQTGAKLSEPEGPIEVEKTPGGGERILVVEDEDAVRGLVERILSQLGYEVTTVVNGVEALSLVEEKELEPDLVITDVVMPNMSGKV